MINDVIYGLLALLRIYYYVDISRLVADAEKIVDGKTEEKSVLSANIDCFNQSNREISSFPRSIGQEYPLTQKI